MAGEAVRELRLKIHYEDVASGPLAQFHAAERKRIQDTAKEQDKSDQAYVRAIRQKISAEKQGDAERSRMAKQAQAEQRKAEQEQLRAIRTAASEQAKAERQQVQAARAVASEQAKAELQHVKAVREGIREHEKAERTRLGFIREAEREQAKAERERMKAIREVAREQQKAEREQVRAIRDAAREQDRSDKAYVRAKMKQLQASKQVEDQERRTADAAHAQTVGVLKMVAGLAGLQSVVGVLGSVSDHFDKIRNDAFKAAEDVMRMRGAVRELAALRDQLGSTGPTMSHILGMASQTLQTPQDVQQMESAGLGVGELALKTPNDRIEFDKMMMAAGKMQAMEGGDAGAYGQLAGQIALQSKKGINAADAEGRMNRLYQIQKPGTFRTMSQAMGQYNQLNGLVMNDIYTPEQAMGLASVFSISAPEQAATKVEQFTRSVMAGRIKARGMKVSEDVDLVTTDKYFKSLGIGAEDDAIKRGQKIAADLGKQKAAVTKAGKIFNPYEYLMTHGFGNVEDRQAILDFAGITNSGAIDKIAEAERAPLELGGITKKFNARSKDRFFQGRRAELSEQMAGIRQGEKEEPLVIAQRAAFGRLKNQGKITGTFEEWKGADWRQRITNDVVFGGYHSQVNRETVRALESERKRLHIGHVGFFGTHDNMLREARIIEKAGGDITGGAARDLAAAAAALKRVTEKQEAALNREAQKPGPALINNPMFKAALRGAGG